MNIHFSSKTDQWATPQEFFDKLNAIHHFELDACADKENAKCKSYITKEEDSFKIYWSLLAKSIWMNPPYGREISKWMRKAYEESLEGCKVVCLVPARTDTIWWFDYAMKGKIEFIKGRLKFGGNKNSAPFPSAIVIFEGSNHENKRI